MQLSHRVIQLCITLLIAVPLLGLFKSIAANVPSHHSFPLATDPSLAASNAADIQPAIGTTRYAAARYPAAILTTKWLGFGNNRAAFIPNDERYAEQWWLSAIHAQDAWNISTGNPELIIAILDTGVAANHPEFAGRILPGNNFVDKNNNSDDDNGHGTLMAGVASAAGNNKIGIAGIAWRTKILPVKVLDAKGQGLIPNIKQGIQWAVDQGARVIVIGYTRDNRSSEYEAVRYALARNVVIVAAAGNDPSPVDNYPAAYEGVIAVTASTRGDNAAPNASHGAYVDIAAPGTEILSTSSPAGYEYASGSSLASPMVAGAVALILSINPNLTPPQVELLLRQTADDIGTPGFDPYTGWGRLNLLKALQQAPIGPTPLDNGSIKGTISGITYDQIAEVQLRSHDGNILRTTLPDHKGEYAFYNVAIDKYIVELVLKEGSGYNVPAPQVVELKNGKDSTVQLNFSITKAGKYSPSQPVPAPIKTGDRRYFAETQHTLQGDFRSYWNDHGGVSIFGYPISEPFWQVIPADGKTYMVQYFERSRLEYHPEQGNTSDKVRPGLLGREAPHTQSAPFISVPPASSPAEGRYFTETQHTLQGRFLSYWQDHEGLTILGYPISEEFQEENHADSKTYIVQYFERSRLEYHPDLANTPYEVLLGSLGQEAILRAPDTFQAVTDPAPSPDVDYFAATQHNLQGAFRKFWRDHEGSTILGYPITEEFQEVSHTDGKTYTVQYFERSRLEYHPDLAGSSYTVLPGLLGWEAPQTVPAAFAPVPPTATGHYFPETQHTLQGRFLIYWQDHEGQIVFGYPISEEFQERNSADGEMYTVQYFERSRLEYHPEWMDTPYEILPGFLGKEICRVCP